jgi:hypothetical protein
MSKLTAVTNVMGEHPSSLTCRGPSSLAYKVQVLYLGKVDMVVVTFVLLSKKSFMVQFYRFDDQLSSGLLDVFIPFLLSFSVFFTPTLGVSTN